jgi:hypothetical protein
VALASIACCALARVAKGAAALPLPDESLPFAETYNAAPVSAGATLVDAAFAGVLDAGLVDVDAVELG